jgi:uncharacterized protein YdaU (DUF1376 family)
MSPNNKAVQAGTRTAQNTAINGRDSSKRIKQPFWLPFNTESYRASTADLSTLEHGAFLLLRLHYWHTGPLKNDNKILARIAGLSASEWRKVRPSLERFFEIDQEWINAEWDVELEKAFECIDKKSKAGKKAADARWQGERDQSESRGSDTNRMRGASESDTDWNANYKSGGRPPENPSLASGEVERFCGLQQQLACESIAVAFPGDGSLEEGAFILPNTTG